MNRRCGSVVSGFCLLFCFGLFPAISLAQQTKPVISVLRKFDAEDNEAAIVIHSVDVFQSDVDRLFADLGQDGFRPLLGNITDSIKKQVDSKQPVLLPLFSTSFKPMILGTALAEEQRDNFVETDQATDSRVQIFKVPNRQFWGNFELAGIKGDEIVLGEDAQGIQQLLLLDRLSTELDEGSRELFNESGFSFYSQANTNPLNNTELQWGSLTDHEEAFLTKLKEKFDQPFLGMLGMKYHEKTFDLRLRFQLSEQIDDLFRTDLQSENYDPDLGMMADSLLAAVSLRTDVAKDSAFMRLLQNLGLEFGSRSHGFSWLGGSTLRVLFELVGDSWVDLEVARGAVYQGTAKTGKLTFIGVVDCRDPAIVMQELERISTLTQPLPGDELSEEQLKELNRLIELLASEDPVQVARAETRLALAGPRSLNQLEMQKETADPKVADSLDRIINRIRSEANFETSELAVMEPDFWSRLRPGLQLSQQTGDINGNPVHTITVTPDPEKSEQAVLQATGAMVELFGKNWDRIQVVEINKHLVFMIGSDDERLKKVVSLVQQGKGELDSKIPKFGNPNTSGAMQVYAFLETLTEFVGILGPNYKAADDPQMSFGSVEFEKQSMETQFLIPTDSIVPFMRSVMF